MLIKIFSRLAFASLIFLICGSPSPASAQVSPAQSQVASRIVSRVDNSVRVTIQQSTHPLARSTYEVGPLADDAALRRMILVMGASPDQGDQLQTLLDSQQSKGSPDYHRWLTPDEFGARFGPSQQDMQQVTAWLQEQGFTVDSVPRGGGWIEFSGTAGQVRSAFGAQMRQYQMGGKMHIANATDISVPAALAPVVRGVSLHDFFKKPMLGHFEQVRRNSRGELEVVRPDLTVTNNNGTSHFLAPGDYAKIYDLNPLYTGNLKGQGQTIAIVARSNINMSDITQFRQTFFLPANTSSVVVNGPDPGEDIFFGDGIEATLDTEWSGAVAPGATIKVVVSGSTLVTDGVDLSAAFIVENNLADIMSISFGECEKNLGGVNSVENNFWRDLFQQAAAEGISVFVASGDNGNAGCDDPNPNTTPAAGGPAVSGLASTQFNTAVGGTEFNETVNGGSVSAFWNTTNSKTDFSSVTGYIPEMAWNESCSPGQANTDCEGHNFFELFAGSGGVSTLYSKPSWQSISIQGVPADLQRDLPDVSLAAAGGHDGILICFETGDPTFDLNCSSSTDASGNPVLTNAGVVGGTSASSPSFAGIMALVDQKVGGRQGLANYVLYSLAKAENFSSCNSSNRTDPTKGSTCVFNDITAGNTNVPGQPGFSGAVGFDMATGLGSVDANNLVNAWATAAGTFQGTVTSITTSMGATVNITHGQSVTLTAQVQKSPSGAGPTGNVAFVTDKAGPQGGKLTVGAGPLSGTPASFSAPFTNLPGGTYNLSAHYPGDGVFAASDSAGIPVNVAKENSSIAINPEIVNLTTGTVTAGTSVPYGDTNLILVFETKIAGVSGQGFPSGSLVYDDGASQITSGMALNNRGQVEFVDCLTTPCFTVGPHSITASYGGDNSFNSSNTTSSPLAITITKGNPTPIVLVPLGAVAGQQFNLQALVDPGLGTIVPTGTIQFMDGTTALGAPVTLSGGQASLPVTFNAAGTHSITAKYSGDNTFNAATSAAATVTVTAPFTFSATSAAQTIPAGGTATYNVTLNNVGGITAAINFTCAGAPGGASCTVSPNPANLTALTLTVPLTVTVSNTANARLAPRFKGLPFVFAGVLAVVLAGLWRKRRQLLFVLLAMFLIGGVNSCGGGGGGGPRPPTNATLTVTGTSGSVSNSITLTLTVTH